MTTWAGVRAALVRRWRWIAAVVVVLVVLAAVGSYLSGAPLRRYVQREMNKQLNGYTVALGGFDFHPIGFEFDLRDVVLRQNAYPDPPVMRVRTLTAHVQWSALFHGRLVADFTLEEPALYVNRANVEKEVSSGVPLGQRGWQDALQAAYPLKINDLHIVDGSITYVDPDHPEPLSLSKIEADAHDIRNVRSAPGEFPSPVTADAVIFGSGRVKIDGAADFLAKPQATLKGRIALDRVALGYFTPVLARYNIVLHGGVLSGSGRIEYTPQTEVVELEDLRIEGLRAEYLYHKGQGAAVKQATATTEQKASEVSNQPGLLLRARRLHVGGATVGFVDEDATPKYRVFMSDLDLDVQNFSNQLTEGTSVAHATGKFMGSGATVADATFRPETNGPDFDMKIAIADTDMRTMNDVLRANGGVDVSSGVFSFFSELGVKSHRVTGWVKPLFRDVRAYSPEKDRGKSFGAKVKERLVDLAANVLKNRPRREVATETDIGGPLEDPRASLVQVLTHLVENAFFKAILPGFQREVGRKR